MKKICLILLFVSALFLSACRTKVVNEIYNITYEGNISIEDFEDLTQAVIKKSESSVLTVYRYKNSFGGLSRNGIGSSVIYEAKAVLLDDSIVDAKEALEKELVVRRFEYKAITNYHVIEDAYSVAVVSSKVFDEIEATVVKKNKLLDLAVLSFSSHQYFLALEFFDSEQLLKGSFVIAIGSPYGSEFEGSASFGIISSPKRYVLEENDVYNEYIQHDAAINPGNSGGALVNMKGQLVGINTMKLNIGDEKTEGMGFAIPSNIIKEFVYDEGK